MRVLSVNKLRTGAQTLSFSLARARILSQPGRRLIYAGEMKLVEAFLISTWKHTRTQKKTHNNNTSLMYARLAVFIISLSLSPGLALWPGIF